MSDLPTSPRGWAEAAVAALKADTSYSNETASAHSLQVIAKALTAIALKQTQPFEESTRQLADWMKEQTELACQTINETINAELDKAEKKGLL